MNRPCALCGSIGCKHSLLERLYGIRSMPRDPKDEARERVERASERRTEEEMRRKERETPDGNR